MFSPREESSEARRSTKDCTSITRKQIISGKMTSLRHVHKRMFRRRLCCMKQHGLRSRLIIVPYAESLEQSICVALMSQVLPASVGTPGVFADANVKLRLTESPELAPMSTYTRQESELRDCPWCSTWTTLPNQNVTWANPNLTYYVVRCWVRKSWAPPLPETSGRWDNNQYNVEGSSTRKAQVGI